MAFENFLVMLCADNENFSGVVGDF